MKRPLLAAATALACTLPACGSLDSHTDKSPTLATIHGQLTNPQSIAIQGAVRVAVVWQVMNGSTQFAIAEDLPVQPVFPSSFAIDLDGPPPPEAMQDAAGQLGTGAANPPSGGTVSGGSGGGPVPPGPAADAGANGASKITPQSAPSAADPQVAVGIVVAYADQNGNGKLDLVTDDAGSYVDQIVATNETQIILYLQGTPPSNAVDASGHLPVQGYNLFSACDVRLADSPSPGSLCPPQPAPPQPACTPGWRSIDTPVTLIVSNDPQVSELMCVDSSQSGTSENSTGTAPPVSVQPAQYPAACDPNVQCSPDGSEYTYSTCNTVSAGLCKGTVTSCTTVTYTRPTPAPSAWPCVH
jgi:hypothetical protein